MVAQTQEAVLFIIVTDFLDIFGEFIQLMENWLLSSQNSQKKMPNACQAQVRVQSLEVRANILVNGRHVLGALKKCS